MVKNNNHNSKQDISIAQIQKDIEFIKCEIVEIKNNHLKALKEEFTGLRTKIENLKEEVETRPTWSISMLVALSLGLITFLIAHFFVH